MPRNLYIGNLPYSITSAELHEIFEEAGELKSAHVVTDRETGRSKGFGFVLYIDEAAGDDAEEKFDKFVIQERTIIVKPAINKARRDYRGS
jgi:cold-inducible RNA-binding protein